MRAAIYARISSDPNDQRWGVERQLERGAEVAGLHGWTVAGTYEDNDLSGFKPTVKRPQFDALCAAIEAGEVDAVVVQHQDRLARNVGTFRRFADLLLRHDVALESWSGPIDITSAAGMFQSTVQAAVSEHYAADLSQKARDSHAGRAAQGRPNGGRRPFGYERTTTEDGKHTLKPHDTEAPVVQEIYRRFLDGESIRSVTMDLQERGFTATTGNPISRTRMRDILTNPTYAGKRTHRGQVVAKAIWPALIDEVTFERVQRKLAVPGRHSSPGVVKRYFLSGGVLRCGKCGYRMKSAPKRGKRAYACPPRQDGGCNGVRRLAEPLEEYVEQYVLAALADPELERALARMGSSDDEIAAVLDELEEVQDRKNELAVMFTGGQIDAAQLAAGSADLDRQHRELKLKRDRLAPDTVTPDVVELRRLWETGSAEWRSQVVAVLFEKIIVKPAVPGRTTFDPGRVELIWRS